MNIKQKISELITKYKHISSYKPLINDLCRLHFEVDEQERKESPFEGSQVKNNVPKSKHNIIDGKLLESYGFEKLTNCYYTKECKNEKGLIIHLYLYGTYNTIITSQENSDSRTSYPFLAPDITEQQLIDLVWILFRFKLTKS